MLAIRVFPVENDADQLRSLDVWNAVHPREPVGELEAREWKRQSRHAEVFLAELDGGLAGAAHVAITTYTDIPAGEVYVFSQHRRHGVGQALYAAVSDWAAGHGGSVIHAHVDDDDPESLAWAERRGFVEHSRDAMVELDLAGYEPRAAEPPAGVEIVSWADRPDLSAGIYEVATEAWPDIPGSEHEQIEPYDEFLSVHMQGEGDRPEAVFVAVAAGEAVGYAKFSFWDAVPDTLFHDLTGVKRAWRSRGIARALKLTQVNWAKDRGYARLRTANEPRNEPIRRLNGQLGYRPIPGRIIVEGPLATGA
ncbi:MAG: GNAT family N-acetyltransferase [Gaiellaceae bacterium]